MKDNKKRLPIFIKLAIEFDHTIFYSHTQIELFMPDATISSPVFLLECVSGKDSRRKIIVSQSLIRMGNQVMQPDIAVTELSSAQGYIEFTAGSATVHFDASDCSATVYLNNNETRAGIIHMNDIFRIGDSLWRIQNGTGYSSGSALKERFNELIGL